jgi:hypothetical protein
MASASGERAAPHERRPLCGQLRLQVNVTLRPGRGEVKVRRQVGRGFWLWRSRRGVHDPAEQQRDAHKRHKDFGTVDHAVAWRVLAQDSKHHGDEEGKEEQRWKVRNGHFGTHQHRQVMSDRQKPNTAPAFRLSLVACHRAYGFLLIAIS